jgi:hypothetical protein
MAHFVDPWDVTALRIATGGKFEWRTHAHAELVAFLESCGITHMSQKEHARKLFTDAAFCDAEMERPEIEEWSDSLTDTQLLALWILFNRSWPRPVASDGKALRHLEKRAAELYVAVRQSTKDANRGKAV